MKKMSQVVGIHSQQQKSFNGLRYITLNYGRGTLKQAHNGPTEIA